MKRGTPSMTHNFWAYDIVESSPHSAYIIITTISTRWASKKFIAILINNKDFEVDNFGVFRYIFSMKFNITSSNKRSQFISPKKEVAKVTFLANGARGARL